MDLLKFAAGWLGWTQPEVLNSDVNFLLAAIAGRVDMLQRIFGSSSEEEPKPKGVTKPDLMQFVRTNNALMRKGRIRKARKGS